MTADFKDLQPLIIWFVGVIFFAVIIGRLAMKKSIPPAQRLEEWAKRNGVEIISAEMRTFFKGPYFWLRASLVYRIVARGPDKETVVGWISFHLPLFGKDWEEVRWGEGAVAKFFETN